MGDSIDVKIRCTGAGTCVALGWRVRLTQTPGDDDFLPDSIRWKSPKKGGAGTVIRFDDPNPPFEDKDGNAMPRTITIDKTNKYTDFYFVSAGATPNTSFHYTLSCPNCTARAVKGKPRKAKRKIKIDPTDPQIIIDP